MDNLQVSLVGTTEKAEVADFRLRLNDVQQEMLKIFTQYVVFLKTTWEHIIWITLKVNFSMGVKFIPHTKPLHPPSETTDGSALQPLPIPIICAFLN